MDELYEKMNDDLEFIPTASGESKIQKYFAEKSILLTGATGFVGKCFIEKILRDCPDLKRLYVLIRQKKGISQEKRMKRYFSDFIFDRIKNQDPDIENKIITINGDLQEECLGISPEDRQLLIDNVDIIVHNGATVKFNEVVSVSLKINVLATKHMLDLASECKHLLSFNYVSTAYSHCYRKDIEEKFYESPADLKTVYDMIASDEIATNGLSNDAIKMLLGEWPNIYTFSKSIAEDLVRQYGERFPCCIYRPSIVSAALHEPTPGWIGNNNGPASVCLGICLGLIHAAYYERVPIDIVPADYSINALIAAIYDCPNRWQEERKGLVYNFGSSTTSPTYMHELYEHVVEEAPNIGSKHAFWHHFIFFTDKMWFFYFLHFFLHFIPALFIDLALICIGQKSRALKLFWLGTSNLDGLSYFVNGNWRIYTLEMLKVLDRLNPQDRQIFPYDMRNFDYAEFIVHYMRGARVYMLKEPLDNVLETTKRYRRMRLLHNVTTSIFFLLLAYLAAKLLTSFVKALI